MHTHDIPQFSARKIRIPDKQSQPARKAGKRVLICIGVVLLLVGSYVGFRVFSAGNKMFEGNILGIFSKSQGLKADEYGRSNIIIFGTTEDSEAHKKIGANQHRTDSIMLLSIHQEDSSAILTSVPRDMWVRYEEKCAGRDQGKINVVYLCGSNNGKNEAKGSRMLMNAVSDVYGIDVHYFIHVNFGGVQGAIDAVGGVEVEIASTDPRGIYDPAIGIRYPNGPVTLDGESALKLSRARDSTGAGYGLAGGNFSREAHQQKILVALRDKAASAGTLTNLSAVTGLINSLGDNVRTNFNMRDVRLLVALAREIHGEEIESVRLNDPDNMLVVTDRVSRQSVVRPKLGLFEYRDIHSFMHRTFSDRAVVEEESGSLLFLGEK